LSHPDAIYYGMLYGILVAAILATLLGMRIAALPPFALIRCLFSSWAERCRHGPELN
jgi:hypothetical protein